MPRICESLWRPVLSVPERSPPICRLLVSLCPLPIPSRPWSHIAVDFVTGLPPSEGNSVILTIIDRFSKSVRYVPLPKLPSAFDTANLLINHVFKLHGIPMDIVSDRGPQFASQVWKDFCKVGAASHPAITPRLYFGEAASCWCVLCCWLSLWQAEWSCVFPERLALHSRVHLHPIRSPLSCFSLV